MHGLKPAPQSPYNNAHWQGPDARRLPSITLRGRLPHTRTSNHPLAPYVCERADLYRRCFLVLGSHELL